VSSKTRQAFGGTPKFLRGKQKRFQGAACYSDIRPRHTSASKRSSNLKAVREATTESRVLPDTTANGDFSVLVEKCAPQLPAPVLVPAAFKIPNSLRAAECFDPLDKPSFLVSVEIISTMGIPPHA